LGDGKDGDFEKAKNALKSEGGYGISIELIFCSKYPPNAAI